MKKMMNTYRRKCNDNRRNTKTKIPRNKNEKGVYVTPAFPKLIYVLDEHNCLKGGKYDYLTKTCSKMFIKKNVSRLYISKKNA